MHYILVSYLTFQPAFMLNIMLLCLHCYSTKIPIKLTFYWCNLYEKYWQFNVYYNSVSVIFCNLRLLREAIITPVVYMNCVYLRLSGSLHIYILCAWVMFSGLQCLILVNQRRNVVWNLLMIIHTRVSGHELVCSTTQLL